MKKYLIFLSVVCLFGNAAIANHKFDPAQTQQDLQQEMSQQDPFYQYDLRFRVSATADYDSYKYWPDDKDFEDKLINPVSLALFKQDYDTIQSLVQNGEYIPKPGVSAGRVLFMTINAYTHKRVPQIKMMETLASYEVDLNQYVDNGDTPLILAVFRGDTQMVSWLLEHQALLEKPSRTNMFTPLLIAATYGYVDIVQQLLEKGANVNTTNERGWTPLMGAGLCLGADDALLHSKPQKAQNIWKNCQQIANILRPLTENPQARDKSGRSADDYAAVLADRMIAPIDISVQSPEKNTRSRQKPGRHS